MRVKRLKVYDDVNAKMEMKPVDNKNCRILINYEHKPPLIIIRTYIYICILCRTVFYFLSLFASEPNLLSQSDPQKTVHPLANNLHPHSHATRFILIIITLLVLRFFFSFSVSHSLQLQNLRDPAKSHERCCHRDDVK